MSICSVLSRFAMQPEAPGDVASVKERAARFLMCSLEELLVRGSTRMTGAETPGRLQEEEF